MNLEFVKKCQNLHELLVNQHAAPPSFKRKITKNITIQPQKDNQLLHKLSFQLGMFEMEIRKKIKIYTLYSSFFKMSFNNLLKFSFLMGYLFWKIKEFEN